MTTAARSARRFGPIHFVLGLLLALGGVVAVAAPAHADVDKIQGTVSGPPDLTAVTVYLSQELSGAVVAPHGRVFTMFGARSTGVDPITGAFEFASVDPGDYYVLVDAGDDWVQHIEALTVDGSTDLGSFTIALEPGVLITGTVRDALAPATPLPGVVVGAFDSSSFFVDWLSFDIDAGGFGGPVTGSDGVYRIVVPLGGTFELVATDLVGDYLEQSWSHRSGCGCVFDPIVTSPSTTGPFDFDLIPYDELIDVSVYAMQWDGSDYENVDIRLEKLVSSTWTLFDQARTDSGGFADLVGGGTGDYRLRYSIGGVTAIVTLAVEPSCGCGGGGTFTLADGGRQTLLGTLTALDYYEVDLTFAKPASTSGGGAGTSAPPRPRTSFTLPTSTPSPSPTPTPTPSATPTPTPSSSPTSEPSESPTPSPTPDPVPAGDAGFPWWIILIIVLAIGIVVVMVILLRRR